MEWQIEWRWWKNAKALFGLGLRHFRGLPSLRDHSSSIHIHKHLLRICLEVKVTQVMPGSPCSFQSLVTLSLTPHLTLQVKDPESCPASPWAPWTWNFNFSRSALAPTMRFCRLHPVSTVASPHPDFLSLSYQHPCPTTDARQALLKASWQVENSHTALPAHTSPSKALPWSRHQPVSLPGLTCLSFQLVSPSLPSCTLRSSYSHSPTLLNTPRSLLPQGLCTSRSLCLQGSFSVLSLQT